MEYLTKTVTNIIFYFIFDVVSIWSLEFIFIPLLFNQLLGTLNY